MILKVKQNENPYDVIGNYIEKHIPVIDDVIAVISIDGKIRNELLLVDGEIGSTNNLVWQIDWWEGEENVELVDFFFVSDACKKNNNNDLISRQAAIDALAEDMPSTYTPDGSHPADEGIFMAQEIYADCIQTLKELPSAQPEPLTDKEQRIFLAAMGRERKVCKEVDDQYTHEPYEVLLTKVCSEIERKVKKALWS